MRIPDRFRCGVLALGLFGAGVYADALGAQQRVPLTDGWQVAPETIGGQRPTEGWRDVAVPSTFEDVLGADFDGVCWYRVALTRPADADAARCRVLFHGAATAATVFADGLEVGGHLGAWTPWHVDVSAALVDREGLLEVRVDEKVGHNTQGFLPIIQPHFGGLWRSVELCIDRTDVFDREQLFAFADASGATPHVEFAAALVTPAAAGGLSVRISLCDGDLAIATATVAPRADAHGALVASGVLAAPADVRRWDPDRPNLYRVVFELLDAATHTALDTATRRVGFRDMHAVGTTVLWNGRPLQIRGMLHWGYSPPNFAPPEDDAWWRRQLEDVKSIGCNMLKVCLWVPPQCVYEIADEIGLVIWQEYPTWHPTLTEAFLPDLRREYDEFHRYDRGHVSVAIRSLTCETGHSAELSVIQALYDRCKELVPQTLVVDDSAWIEWHRVHDFYDDHPYGNNSWWPGKLAQMKAHIAARDPMPLLLGECIASDTWMDLAAWDASGTPDDAWWAPWGLGPQREFEQMVERRFGPATRQSLRPTSLAYALRNRKYQIERLRVDLPDAGYTLSVIRDFTKARMGFLDDFGQLKWDPSDWAWHRDTLIALDAEPDRDHRALLPGATSIGLRISHFGRGALRGSLRVSIPEWGVEQRVDVSLAEGALSPRIGFDVVIPEVSSPMRFRIDATLEGTHPASNHWDLWAQPRPTGLLDPDVRVVDHLDRDTLAFVRDGGRALLLAGDRKGSLKTAGIWFLKGAPWAPPHPIQAELPAEYLTELQAFDLEAGHVMHGEPWIEHVDPVLAFWDTHDVDRVNPWLLAFTAQLGAGRLGATVLERDTPAGRWVLERLVDHLAHGPAPRSTIPDALVDTLASALSAEAIDLKTWSFAIDPNDQGVAGRWMDGGDHDGAAWRPIEAGRHWEAQGVEHYDGVAWYRTTIDIPERWRGQTVTLVCEGVDDSYRLYLNGAEIGRYGDPATGESVWLVRTTADLSRHLRYGAENTLALRVVDHVGAGGVYKPVFVTTGPVDAQSDLVH